MLSPTTKCLYISLFQDCQVPFFFTWQNSFICHISYCQLQVSWFSAMDWQYTRLMDTSQLPFPHDTPPLPCPLPCPVKLTPLDLVMAGEQELYWCLQLSPWQAGTGWLLSLSKHYSYQVVLPKSFFFWYSWLLPCLCIFSSGIPHHPSSLLINLVHYL